MISRCIPSARPSARVIWGSTPVNDSLSSAVPLVGSAGSITGSNRFATNERGESASALGHSSLWWTYEAPATGWYRFWIDESDAPWVLGRLPGCRRRVRIA